MYRYAVNLLKGQVTGRVESGFPERVLNICAEHAIAFWDLRWESEVAFTFTMTRRDWRRLRKVSRRLDCAMQVSGWKGVPFFLGRMRRRYALWITLLCCVTMLFYGSFFIWDITIEGNETVSDREIAISGEGMILRIKGENLVLTGMTGHALRIQGEIQGLEWVK